MVGKVVSMEARLAVAFARRIDAGLDVSAFCRREGISRQTFYVYERRYRAEGEVGLLARSRAPGRHRNQTPVEMEELILAYRAKIPRGMDNGARSIWARMKRAGADPPSARTVHRVLVRRGLVEPQPAKRPRSSYRRFVSAQPNGCWQIDGMRWHLADGSEVTIARVLDDHSRMGLANAVDREETGAAAWRAVSAGIERHGAPAMFLSDNSLAFNGSRRGALVDLERRLRELGVAVVSSRNRHPQTTGKAEREHQTLQKWLRAQPAARTTTELERQLDVYDVIYNQNRPHQELGEGTQRGLVTPAEAYRATAKAVPADQPLPAKPIICQVKVSGRGVARTGGFDIQIGRGWEGITVTVVRDGNQVAILHNRQLVHSRTIDPTRRYQPSGAPRTGKRIPRRAGGQPAASAEARRSQDGAPAAQRGRTTLTPTNAGAPSPCPPA